MSSFFDLPAIRFEGLDSDNPLAYRHYDRDAVIEGKTMAEHLRFAVAFWHSMITPLSDPFGEGTALHPWDDGSQSLENARRRIDAFFELIEKLGVDYYTFHDRDVAPELNNLTESTDALREITEYLKEKQQETGKKLLWGTCALFKHPRYAQGAATSPNPDVFAYAGAQVKAALETTKALNGDGFTLWGGREGHASLINTDMRRERDHLGLFLHMLVDYKKEIGFDGQLFLEPKPKEPMSEEYDRDVATTLNFLREYDLLEHFQLNIEINHAQLAGHTIEHELQLAAAAGALGSVDANDGDKLLGWDTDQYPSNLYWATQTMLSVLNAGGFTRGGLNFDAKRRRESFEPEDLFYGHILGIDTYARALKTAAAIRADGGLADFIKQRYADWDSGIGAAIENREVGFTELAEHVVRKGEPKLTSGRQEMLENIFNRFL